MKFLVTYTYSSNHTFHHQRTEIVEGFDFNMVGGVTDWMETKRSWDRSPVVILFVKELSE